MSTLILIIHALSGTIGILAGFATLLVEKATPRHMTLGTVFVIAMLFLGVSGSLVAYSRSISLSLINGLLLCYLIGSSWLTINNKANKPQIIEKMLAVIPLGLCFSLIHFAQVAAESPTGKLDSFSAPVFYFFAFIAGISFVSDIVYFMKGGYSGHQKTIRHLWRMCFPLFMATAAFFLGQAKLFPAPMQNIFLLAAPVVFVIIAMFYWLLKELVHNYKAS